MLTDEQVIERLKKTREDSREASRRNGEEEGEQWAREQATWFDLRNVARAKCDDDLADMMNGYDEYLLDRFCGDEDEDLSPYSEGFVKGARKVFELFKKAA